MDSNLQKTFLKRMITIRTFEEVLKKVFYRGEIPGFIHLSIGQEATAVGACAALKDTDYIGTTHRCHGHIIAKDVDLNRMMAEIYGRVDGFCRGRGGSMHIIDREKGLIGSNAIVGAGLPILAGAALAAKLENKGRVALSFFGDGTSNQGAFHEALNLAAVWKLPVIFLCENNLYSEFTPTASVTAVTRVAERAGSYKIPGITVDGNDVEAVYAATTEAVGRAREGEGPTLLECLTYRLEGHVFGEEAFIGSRPYRSKEEVEHWKNFCPITRYKAKLIEAKVMTQAEIEEMEKAVQAELDQAITFARNSPLPSGEQALEDVYA